jgi:hypothetical protein
VSGHDYWHTDGTFDLDDRRLILGRVADRFRACMELMRRRDPQAQEDGFHLLLPHAADHVEELIAEFRQQRNSHGLRCWLLELIGEARSPLALPLLVEQLYSDDESMKSWARHGLEKLDTKQARQELWKARANGATP